MGCFFFPFFVWCVLHEPIRSVGVSVLGIMRSSGPLSVWLLTRCWLIPEPTSSSAWWPLGLIMWCLKAERRPKPAKRRFFFFFEQGSPRFEVTYWVIRKRKFTIQLVFYWFKSLPPVLIHRDPQPRRNSGSFASFTCSADNHNPLLVAFVLFSSFYLIFFLSRD